MRLADFIEQNAREIVDGAEAFAKTQAPPGVTLNAAALRNDIPRILAAVVLDLRTPQGAAQQKLKSQGLAPPMVGPESAASSHGRLRARSGFDVNHMVAEFRALRAAVLRLWAADEALTKVSIEDIIRFNEAIDQAVAESLVDFTKETESWRRIFLGVLGHDLRGPLSAIVTTSDVLTRKTADTPFSELAARIALSGMRMSKLLDDLLDYNKTQLGIGITIHPSTCDLAQALSEEVNLLRDALPDAAINFHADGPVEGQFDASRIREALHNLVTNAAKYGDPDAEIRVSLARSAEGIQLAISNSGAPLSVGSMNSMFDPIRRGPWSAAKGEEASLGLGLFVVREIVNAHQGNVTVSYTDGKTTFTVWLPRKTEPHGGCE
jgi:signal transduction histidine kinase